MAWSVLFLAVLFFAVRGYFLGLPGVAGRLLGLIGGYLVAFSYREVLGRWLNVQLGEQYPALATEALAGVALFFTSFFALSIGIKLLCQSIGQLLPPLAPLFSQQHLTSRVAGALSNSTLATMLVLVGLWAYGQVAMPTQPSPLQLTANRFGSLLFDEALSQYDNWSYSETKTIIQPNSTTAGQGSAMIQSATKTLRIESQPSDDINNSIPATTPLKTLLEDGRIQQQMQAALNTPKFQAMVKQYLQENPQSIEKLINSPQVQQMLQQFHQQQDQQ